MRVFGVVLAAKRFSPLEVVPEDMAELCVSVLIECNTEVSAKELDDVRCKGCADMLGAGADCGGFTPTIVLTTDVTVCGMFNVTDEPKAELSDCGRLWATEVLAIELTEPGRLNEDDGLAVKLIGCAELDVAELSTIEVDCETGMRLVPIVVTVLGLDADAVPWPGNVETDDCAPELPDPITPGEDIRVELPDCDADTIGVDADDLFDALREAGSWPRMAEIWKEDEVVACDAVVCDELKDIVGIDTVLSFDGSCPRPGLIELDWATLSPPTIEDGEPDDDIVADWVWLDPGLELKIVTPVDNEASLAVDSAVPSVGEIPTTDDNILVELSGGQDTMPRQFRELVEAVIFKGLCKEVEEATEAGTVVNEEAIEDETTGGLLLPELGRLWVDELCKAEPRTTAEDFTDDEETFGTEPLMALDTLVDAEETLLEVGLVVEKEDSRDGEIVALDRTGTFPFVETRDVPEGLCLIEFAPEVVLLELCEAFETELEGSLVELEIFVELASFCEKLKPLLRELDDVLALVEVDARFTELEALLLGLLDSELVVPFVELEATRLVSFEPRIGLMSRDELEALLEAWPAFTEDKACLELEELLLELDPCVDVVGRVEVVFRLVDFERGAPRITEAFLVELAFCVDALTIRPLLVTRAVLLLFDELLLDALCVGRVDTDNARRGNIIVFEEVPGDRSWSSKNASEFWSVEDSGNQPSSLLCAFGSGIWSLLSRNGSGMSTAGTNFLSTSNTESFLATGASTSECLRRDGWTRSLAVWMIVSCVAAPDKDDRMRPPDRAAP
jgi:hypothetical protein